MVHGGWMDGWIMDGWLDSMWSTSTVEYYVAVKRSVALTQATAWTDPEHTILSEGSRHRGTHVYGRGLHFQETTQTRKPVGAENGPMVLEAAWRASGSWQTGEGFLSKLMSMAWQ